MRISQSDCIIQIKFNYQAIVLYKDIFFFSIKIFIRNHYMCQLEKHKIPISYPGLVNISGMYRNCVSLFSTIIIQLRQINKFNTYFESYFMIVSNFFFFIYLLPIYFRFDPRVGRYEKSKMLWFFWGFYYKWNY